jgi:predicted alpha/beta superfamily hydrolase
MLYKLIIFFLLSFLCSGNLFSQDNENDSSIILPKVEIAGTQLLKIHSQIVNQDYELYINLPGNYSDSTQKYPVIYLLDAQWDFPLVSAIYGEQFYDGFIPGVIIVGITWGGENPNYDTLRARDFTPVHLRPSDNFGNAPKFLEFIKKELIPFIESKYRVTNDRTLMGSSLGGLFTLYTLFNETNLFDKYIPTSPAITWGDDVIYNYEKSYKAKNSTLPVKLYTAIGKYEDTSILKAFLDTLQKRSYKNLELKNDVVEGVGHSGEKAEAYTRGLQFVFSRLSLKLPLRILEQYTGIYQLDPENKIKITIDKGYLTTIIPKNNKIVLYAETEKNFYAKGSFHKIHFEKDKSGKVIGFELAQFGGERFIPKVEELIQ